MSKTRGIRKANATDVVFDAGEQGDAYPRIEIHADGTIWTGNGTVAPSDQLGATGPPGVPGTPVATGANVSASLTWTAASPGGSPVTNYVITPYVGSTAQATTTVGNVLAATVTGLTNGTAYTFKIHAVNGIGAGSDSAASNSVTPAATAPGIPTIGVATAGNASATVAFTAPTSDGGSTITGYTATSTPGGHTGSGASSPVSVTGLTNGTVYTFTVHATNAIGSSGESAASNSVTPAAAPFSPADLGSKLKVYLEADDLSAGAVSAWNSISPATVNASQGTSGPRPSCVAADINGHNAVVFDGVNDFLTLGTAKIIGEAAGDQFTIFAVYKMPAASAGWLIARDDNTLGRDFAFGKSGSQAPLITIAGNVGLAGNAVSDNYEYHTMDGTGGGTHQMYVNGVAGQGGSLAASGVTATGPTTIGARSYAGAEGYAGMRLAALYVCTPRCTSGEISSMHAYIASRFAL